MNPQQSEWRRIRTQHRVATLVMLLAVSLALAAPPDEDEWKMYLVEVSYVDRQDPPRALKTRVDELEARLAAGADEDDRTALESDLEKARLNMDRRTGYVLYGWAAKLDRSGERIDRSAATLGFLVAPRTANHRIMGELEPGDFVEFARPQLTRVFSAHGRSYFRTKRLKTVDAPQGWSATGAFRPPPERDGDVAADPAEGIEYALRVSKVEDRETSRRYRYMMTIKVPDPPAGARRLDLWFALRVQTGRGETIGPVIYRSAIERGTKGGFDRYSSWDVFAPLTTPLDADATTVTLIGASWDGR